MNQDLPSTQEYYRPQQATGLRRKAAMLRHLDPLIHGGAVTLLILGPGLWLFYVGHWDCFSPLPSYALPFSVLPAVALFGIAEGLRGQARCCDRKAKRLEAEHQARYAVRSSGGQSECRW